MLRLPADTVTAFVGDVHLGDGGRSDIFCGNDTRLVHFLRRCATDCESVVFMGDAFDLPQGLRLRRITTAHPEVMRTIDWLTTQTRVVFIRGNHDWRVDYGQLFHGAEMAERIEIGDALVWHGHALDDTVHIDRWAYFVAMAAHSFFERVARFHFRVPVQDHDTWQNRVMHWLGHRFARQLRRRGRGEEFIAHWSRAVWGDPNSFFEPVRTFLADSDYRTVVCGHTHLPGVVDLDGRQYVNAGSWTFGAAEVAGYDGRAFSATDVASARPIFDEHYRWMVEGHDPGDFFDWWHDHYRGLFRFRPAVSPGVCAARPHAGNAR
ncbi:MAG: metallophosphoesterase [Acidimicrobiia bacterium]|nr:metallophosphoesterase [Acidimicrobiia bacterium]